MGLFIRVCDLAAAATVIDIGRHQAEINFGHTATHGHSATQPRRHVVFLDTPCFSQRFSTAKDFLDPCLQLSKISEVNKEILV